MRLRVLCLIGLTTVAVLVGSEGASAAAGTTTVYRFTSSGEQRTYRVFRPAGIIGEAPLVVALHGAGGSGAKFERHSGWDALAGKDHLLVAYPSSFERGWRNRGPVDLPFLSRMLDAIESHYPVDHRRVYFTGFSSGAFMTYRIACDLASQVPAIGPVAGAPVEDCSPRPARPVAVIHIQGTADQRIPYLGGQAVANGQPFGMSFPSALDMANRWVRWDKCAPTSRSQSRGAVTVRTWPICRASSEVRLVTLHGWTHEFPMLADGAPIDGPSTIWRFLARFSLPVR